MNKTNISWIIFIFLICIGFWRITLGGIGNVNWDYPIFLDGIWRVTQGQIPHIDFSTPIGPVTFFIGYLGSQFSDLSIHSFDYGTVFLYLVVTFFSYYLSRLYMNVFSSILFTLLVGSYLITSRIIGYPFYQMGYSSYYNFVGYIFVFLIAIDVIFGKKFHINQSWSGVYAGVLTVLSFFTKITFGFGALAFVIIRLFLPNLNRNWGYGYIFGFILCFFCFFYYFNFDLKTVIQDYLIIINATGGGENLIIHLIDLLKSSVFLMFNHPQNLILALLPILSTCIFIYFIYLDSIKKNDNFNFLVFIISLALIGILLMITVNQPPEFVIGSLIAVLFFNWLSVKKRFLNKNSLSFAKYLSLSIVLIAVLNNFLSLPLGTYKKAFMNQERYSNVLNNYSTLKGGFFTKSNQITYEFIDGLEMLKPYIKESDKITVIGVNIFSFSLKQNSTKDDLLYWHDGITYSDRTLIDLNKMKGENIFKETTILMIPLTMINKPTNAINHYQHYIDRNFSLSSQSEYWKMFIKSKQ